MSMNLVTLISRRTQRSSSPGVARYSSKSFKRGIGTWGFAIVRNDCMYSQSQSMIFSGFPKQRLRFASCLC